MSGEPFIISVQVKCGWVFDPPVREHLDVMLDRLRRTRHTKDTAIVGGPVPVAAAYGNLFYEASRWVEAFADPGLLLPLLDDLDERTRLVALRVAANRFPGVFQFDLTNGLKEIVAIRSSRGQLLFPTLGQLYIQLLEQPDYLGKLPLE